MYIVRMTETGFIELSDLDDGDGDNDDEENDTG